MLPAGGPIAMRSMKLGERRGMLYASRSARPFHGCSVDRAVATWPAHPLAIRERNRRLGPLPALVVYALTASRAVSLAFEK